MEQLKAILREMGSTLVAYSGGVDSTFLASVAHDVLGKKTLAVLVDSPVITAEEKEKAVKLARQRGFRFEVIRGCQMENPLFISNPPERCYHCKLDIFRQLKALAEEKELICVSDGSNADDTNDYRPGLKALRESGVRSPLLEAGLVKEDIRRLSREMSLPEWDRPASPCLATRIPYGTPLTRALLERIEQGERYLRSLGLTEFRLRHHGDTARIEVILSETAVLLREETRREVVNVIRNFGYRYVTLDLSGFRSGSLNEGLKKPGQEVN